ncbi:TIGR04282 family arsenosugar biosynthesis glycosyltransferase [Candidatus Omnitrophota bacterium]
MKRCLIIFAKEPQKGKVKTRLKSCLSDTQCLNLYKAFLKDTFDLAKSIKCDLKVLAYDLGCSSPYYLKKAGRSFQLYEQQGRSLGQKMHNAFKSIKGGDFKLVIIGSDSPTLPAIFIEDAFKRLDNNDLVLGPTFDGGYYLVGLKKPCLAIFKGIKWSSSYVLDGTLRNARKLGKKISILKSWYDIDEPRDMAYLKKDLKDKKKNIAQWTRRFLKI